jgi:spore coat polysaccharide biosynthesis protein SpsF
MRSVAIIQARMNSSRLPGKVMLNLCGKTVLTHVVSRVQACKAIDQVVVATTDQAVDQDIVAEAKKLGAGVFCGSETDVLGRYYNAAKSFGAEIIVRVTADCPLFDPEVLSSMLVEFERISSTRTAKIYLSNTRVRTYPRGLDAEIFNFPALETAYHKAKQEFEREHVTQYMHRHDDEFMLYDFTNTEDYSDYRWTLDTPEDFNFIETVYSELYKKGQVVSTDKVINLLKKRPELCKLNADVKQKKIE